MSRVSGWLALLVLLPCGCGLNDYQEKMLAEQERLKRFEREEKELGGPLLKPPVNDSSPLSDFFLRPPKNIKSQPDSKPYADLVYIYPATNKGALMRMGLAWKGKRKDLREDLLKLFNSPEKPVTVTTAPAAEYPPLALEKITFLAAAAGTEPEHTVELYFTPDKQLAILFFLVRDAQNPKPSPEVQNAISFSLNSLAIGPDAGKALVEYNKRFQNAKN